jgi:hypothetical protein
MATSAPRDDGAPLTTPPRNTVSTPIRQGSVVVTTSGFVVAWRRLPSGWLALPVALQHSPLHRSHVPLRDEDLALFGTTFQGRMIVRTADPDLIPREGLAVGRLDANTVAHIGRTIARAVTADRDERVFGAGL